MAQTQDGLRTGQAPLAGENDVYTLGRETKEMRTHEGWKNWDGKQPRSQEQPTLANSNSQLPTLHKDNKGIEPLRRELTRGDKIMAFT